jgi:hypothetical protein
MQCQAKTQVSFCQGVLRTSDYMHPVATASSWSLRRCIHFDTKRCGICSGTFTSSHQGARSYALPTQRAF